MERNRNMMKKTIFFMLCLAPIGAQAAFTDNVLTDTGGTFSTTIRANAMYIGAPLPDPVEEGVIYAGPDVDRQNLSLLYIGADDGVDFTLNGNMEIVNGYSLNLGSAPGYSSVKISLSDVFAGGTLTISGAGALTAKNVTVNAGLNVGTVKNAGAQSMKAGVITVEGDDDSGATGGDTVINVAGDLTMGGFHNTGTGTTDIIAGGNITVGDSSDSALASDIENADVAGNMNITSTGGGLTVHGSVYNSSNTMDIDVDGDVVVDGTIKNDSNDSTLKISGNSLKVSAGDEVSDVDDTFVSFVNKGNLYIDIAGETNLAFGFDLSAMGVDNAFSLVTGSLKFGAGTDMDRWLGVFANKLNDFELIVKSGTLNLQTTDGEYVDIVNNFDVNNEHGLQNADADMIVHAPVIVAGGVTNNGHKLQIGNYEITGTNEMTDTTTSVTINGNVVASENAESTEIDSAGTLKITGNVTHNGGAAGDGYNYMAVTGDTSVTIGGSVSNNNGGKLEVLSSPEDGVINIAQSVVNGTQGGNENGVVNISGNTITIGAALTNYNGVTTVSGNGPATDDGAIAVNIGNIDVQGGAVNLEGLADGVLVNGDVAVTDGGVLNISRNTKSVVANGSILVAGDVLIGNTANDSGNGDVVIATDGVQDFELIANGTATGGEDSNASLTIDGSVNINSGTHNIVLAGNTVSIGQSIEDTVQVWGSNSLKLGVAGNSVETAGAVSAANGGKLEFGADTVKIAGALNIDGNSSLVAHNTAVTASDIDIGGGLYFDGKLSSGSLPRYGLIGAENATELQLSATEGDITFASGATLGSGTIVTLNANNGDVSLNGAVESAGSFAINANALGITGAINNSGVLNANVVNNIDVGGALTNTGTDVELVSTDGEIEIAGDIDNESGATVLQAAGEVLVNGAVTNKGSSVSITSDENAVTLEGALTNNAGGANISANDDVTIGGALANAGTGVSITSAKGDVYINDGGISNTSAYTVAITAETGAVSVDGDVDVDAGKVSITAGADNNSVDIAGNVDVSVGNVELNGQDIDIGGMLSISKNEGNQGTQGAVQISDAKTVNVIGDVFVNGNIVQGNVVGTDNPYALNLVNSGFDFTANALNVTGDYRALAGTTGVWNITEDATISNSVSIADGAGVELNAKNITTGDVTVNKNGELSLLANGAVKSGAISNSGTMVVNANADAVTAGVLTNSGDLSISAKSGITLNSITSNSGALMLDSGAGLLKLASFDVTSFGTNGTITLKGQGLQTTAQAATEFVTNKVLLQNVQNANLTNGQVAIESDDYSIYAGTFDVSGVNQASGSLTVYTNTVDVDGDVEALGDVRFARLGDDWMTVDVSGNVSGGVDLWGIQKATIGENYIFNNSSDLFAAVFAEDKLSGKGLKNYWSTITSEGKNTFGTITNAANNAGALIEIGGQIVSNLSGVALGTNGTQPNVGIALFETVDQGTAIWLAHADGGINISNGFEHLRNLDVKFCNAAGDVCIDYASTIRADGTFGAASDNTTDSSELPIYITERDSDGDGKADSLYVVFNPNYGGPITMFKLQPIVEAVPSHTEGEYVSAGALDDLLLGQVLNIGFSEKSPIEVLPAVFRGTNFADMADALYDRMEHYYMTGEDEPLARFSRLFQARELEQIAGAVALNEHTNFRDFEDRMFDEFIWNRNRNLKKAWLDVDYGLFSQDVDDGKRVKGDRFSISGGFDWQESETMILGLTARISNSSSDNSDAMDLGYLPNKPVNGFVDITVDDLNFGFGGYMMKTLGEKTRLYGNAFLDVHMFDISRDQTFMDHIDGTGTAFSLISEWGLLHDWLNQYIVGNAYARVGYNFGFDITEHAKGLDYMDMQSDGYLVLTPGYSLIAQKRIYPSAWFQIRPYASIGVEYDVLGAPDYVKYKFAPAHTYTKYSIDIDPLWANIGGGVEFLSAMGLQIGIDYRYQYNDAIQLHNIKVSGSYRF